MNVLCDFHHTDLFRSMRLLFEKRLGMKIFRPFGQDWWDGGYFFHPEPAYGRNLLTREPFHKDYVREIPKGAPSHYPHGDDSLEWSWIRLEEAAQTINIVLTTLEANGRAFLKFKKEKRPGAKCIRYMGNEGEKVDGDFMNLLCSNKVIYDEIKNRSHAVFFHPEFDLSLYSWSDPPRLDKPVLRTFLNDIYRQSRLSNETLYPEYKRRLSEHAYFYTHGLGTPPPDMPLDPREPLWKKIRQRYGGDFRMPDLMTSDGEPKDHEEISRLMKRTNMAWHVKEVDGYGFAIHQLYASGRPVICRRKDYEGKTGGLLLEDTKSCVMLEAGLEDNLRKILFYLEPDENRRMCERARDIFRETVDFDREAERIGKFIQDLR